MGGVLMSAPSADAAGTLHLAYLWIRIDSGFAGLTVFLGRKLTRQGGPTVTAIVLVSLVVVATVLAAGGWVIQMARRRRGAAVSFSVVRTVTVLAVVGWCWAVAFDAVFGDVRWLRGPIILVSAMLALGAIYSLTGTRLHHNTAGLSTSRDDAMRLDGWDNDPRYR
jgi:hypothetical protein